MFEYDIDHHIHIPLGIVLWVNKTNDETDVGIFWSDLPGSA